MVTIAPDVLIQYAAVEVQTTSGLWRVLHDWERPIEPGDVEIWNRTARPEVYWIWNDQLELTEALQLFSFEVFKRGAPSLPADVVGNKWTSVFGTNEAFANGTGFPGRRNYILRKDMTAEYPALHKHIICGGVTLKETRPPEMYTWYNVASKKMETSPVVWFEYIDVTKPLPDPATLPPWLQFRAVICYENAIHNFPMGVQKDRGIYEPTMVPIFGNRDLFYPVKWLEPVADIANAYAMPLHR